MFTKTIASAALASLAFAGPRWGERSCPAFEAQADLDLARYAGSWYEITRDKTTPFEILASCVVADYSYTEGEGALGVTNSGYRYHKGWNTVSGSAVPQGDGLVVSFSGMPQLDSEPNYFVVGTDYDTYSIVYSCSKYGGLFAFDLLWVLARETSLSDAKMEEIHKIIAQKLPFYDFGKLAHYTKQGSDQCPYETRYDADFAQN
eukprot:Macronucleus_3939.p1 GENE.Macronucleus_3939~~Macronucleus_3939.p1  ORF type:complete len:204 (+),score=48.54 Macronucleus_3939:1-612(+)